MSGAFILCSALCACVSVVYAKNFGVGIWETLAINNCEENSHKFKFDVILMKINETHDGFKGQFVMEEDFTDAFGIRLEICKYEDNNCKRFQVMTEDCLIDFFNKYAKDSVTACFKAASVDPPEMPIPKGEYEIENYVFTKEPTVSMYGVFNIKAFILQGEEDVGCLEAQMEFKKIEEGNEGEK